MIVCVRLIRKSQTYNENVDQDENIIVVDDVESDEDDDHEGPEDVDSKKRQKEMRKGIDLATTLERIEKNFVITDPRLPDNPIVRFLLVKVDCLLIFSTNYSAVLDSSFCIGD